MRQTQLENDSYAGGKYKSRHYRRWIGQESYGQGDGKNAEQRL